MKAQNRIRLVSGNCYACGVETEETENVPRYGSSGCTIAFCEECQKLGRDKFEDSIGERAAFIQERLKTKYKAHIAAPAWSEEEIGEMSGNLPGEIRRFAAVSAAARQRTSWNSVKYTRYKFMHKR